MGMFDYLRISTSKLPVSDKEKKVIGENHEWQTKDFDCILTTITITDDGDIEIVRFDQKWDDTQKNALGTMGAIVHENVRTEKIQLHGYLNFYTSIKNDWYEFHAKFTDGKLVEITGGKESDG